MDKNELFEFVTTAQVREARDEDLEELLKSSAAADYKTAVADPIVDGKPRMVLMTAWIVHEGRNLNGQVFVKEELDARVREGLFAPPHAGMVDFDHDFEARGFWYKTSFAYDTVAEKWGIIANGAIWAWRFPELADMLLAEMQRNDKIFVSMTAKAESIELISDYPDSGGEPSIVLHNPVFFTTSILDVPPGDPHARAVATEEPSELPAPAEASKNEDVVPDLVAASKQEEDIMEKELSVQLAEALEAKATAEATLAGVNEKLVEAQGTISKFEGELAELKTKVAEFEVALQSASETKEGLEADLTEAKEKLNVFETEKLETEATARLTARIAELPEVVQSNLDEHPEKEMLLDSWKAASDDEWETIKQSFNLAVVDHSDDPDYVRRSKEQGNLLCGTVDDGGESVISKHLR